MEKKFAVILFCGNLFLRIAEKTAKIAKIRACKNLVPHGVLKITSFLFHDRGLNMPSFFIVSQDTFDIADPSRIQDARNCEPSKYELARHIRS